MDAGFSLTNWQNFYRNIRKINILDREQITAFFSMIKGLHIDYFTVLEGGVINEHKR